MKAARAGIPKFVYRLATGWTARRSEFESLYNQDFSPLYVFQTGSGAHAVSYQTGREGFPLG
jgi:hypothetical protein